MTVLRRCDDPDSHVAHGDCPGRPLPPATSTAPGMTLDTTRPIVPAASPTEPATPPASDSGDLVERLAQAGARLRVERDDARAEAARVRAELDACNTERQRLADELAAATSTAPPTRPLSLGERPHDPAGCSRGGQPHLGPCDSAAPQPLSAVEQIIYDELQRPDRTTPAHADDIARDVAAALRRSLPAAAERVPAFVPLDEAAFGPQFGLTREQEIRGRALDAAVALNAMFTVELDDASELLDAAEREAAVALRIADRFAGWVRDGGAER